MANSILGTEMLTEIQKITEMEEPWALLSSLNSNDFSKPIELFNSKRADIAWYTITGIDYTWSAYFISSSDGKFIEVQIKDLVVGILKWYSLDNTYKLWERIQSAPVPARLRVNPILSFIRWDCINYIEPSVFIWYTFSSPIDIYISIRRKSWLIGRFALLYYIRAIAPTLKLDNDWLRSFVDSDSEDMVDTIDRELEIASQLPFIKDVRIEGEVLLFEFYPYDLDYGSWFSVSMPWVIMAKDTKSVNSVWYCYTNRNERDGQKYRHPHISWINICMGNMQQHINIQPYNFEPVLIQLYEILTTFNKNSPYFKPRPDTYNRDKFMMKHNAIIKFKWKEYPYSADMFDKIREDNNLSLF